MLYGSRAAYNTTVSSQKAADILGLLTVLLHWMSVNLCWQTKTINLMYAVKEDVQGLVIKRNEC